MTSAATFAEAVDACTILATDWHQRGMTAEDVASRLTLFHDRYANILLAIFDALEEERDDG